MFVIRGKTVSEPFYVSKDSTIKETLLNESFYSTQSKEKAKKFINFKRAKQWLRITECNEECFIICQV